MAWVFNGCSDLTGGCSGLAASTFVELLDFHVRFFVCGFSFQVFDMVLWLFFGWLVMIWWLFFFVVGGGFLKLWCWLKVVLMVGF